MTESHVPQSVDHPIKNQSRNAKRNRIIEASLLLFAKNGYDATTIRMISKEAGISLGLLYNYFSGKHEVLKVIYEQSISELHEAFALDDSHPDPRKRFDRFTERMFNAVHNNPLFFKLFYAIRMQPSVQKLLTLELIALNNAARIKLVQLLDDLGYREPEMESKLLFALLDGVSNHYVLYHGQFPIDSIRETIVRRYTAGVATPA